MARRAAKYFNEDFTLFVKSFMTGLIGSYPIVVYFNFILFYVIGDLNSHIQAHEVYFHVLPSRKRCLIEALSQLSQ